MQSVFYFPGVESSINLRNCKISAISFGEEIQYIVLPSSSRISLLCSYIRHNNYCWVSIMSDNNHSGMPYSKYFVEALAEEYSSRQQLRRNSL